MPAAATIPAPLSVVKLQHVVFMGNNKEEKSDNVWMCD